MGVWCCYTANCLAKPGIVFEEVSSIWSVCANVHTHFKDDIENVTVTNTVFGFVWTDILHAVFPSSKLK